MPHGMCLFWKPSVLWTLVIANAWIALSYLLIPIVLFHVYIKRKDIQYTWIFLLFAAFILLCGLTHALHVVTYWNPIYGVQGLADATTAIVSFCTAVVLWKLVPDIMKIPTPKALKISEEKYRKLLESVQHGICTFDKDYKINFVNKAGCKILDKIQEQVINFDIRNLFNLESCISHNEHGESIINAESRQKIIDYKVSQVELLNQETLFLFTFNDITIFKDINSWDNSTNIIQSAKSTQARIFESQKLESLGQFAGGIAHDFNNTLAVIKGSLEILNDLIEINNENVLHQLQIAEKAVKNSSDFVKQLLAFSKNKSNLISRTNLNINDILRNIVNLNKTIMSSKITVNVYLAENLWGICANESQLMQIFSNLINNSAYAMQRGGELNIYTENFTTNDSDLISNKEMKAGSYVKVTVSDTGDGISKENLGNIFTPFFSTKPIGDGTGLGLSVIYSIMLGNKGYIFVDSELNVGTDFHLYFPKASSKVSRKLKSKAKEKLKNSKVDINIINNKHILIVDDEEDLREIFDAYLSVVGANTYDAQDGVEALSLYKKLPEQIDLIILDTNMPRMDGVAVYKEVRVYSKSLPILFISAQDEDEDLSQIIRSDSNVAWLAKPFAKDELLAASAVLLQK